MKNVPKHEKIETSGDSENAGKSESERQQNLSSFNSKQ